MSPIPILEEPLEQALRTSRPTLEVRALAARWLAEGQPREAVVRRLEDARALLLAAGREADDDVMLEVLDFVVGWCSPHMTVGTPLDPAGDEVSVKKPQPGA